MLTPAIIAHLRLHNQQIAQSRFKTPQEIVAWHGAKQAQDYNHAKWAVGLRLPESTDQMIEEAIEAGSIVRTHIMRPTWHLVSAADVRWLMQLTAPQVMMQSIAREKDLGLNPETFRRTNEVIYNALAGSRQLTRQELAEAIEQAGIMTNSMRMVHIMFRAELDLLVCNGSRRGKEQTYALLDERVAATPVFSREESLATLAKRYFTSHAPATLQDFTWWSGLKVTDARAALELIKPELKSMSLENLIYWMPKDLELPVAMEPTVQLLPAFDEFMVSYKFRDASLDPVHSVQAITGNGIFKPIVVVNGRVAGVWNRTEKKNAVVVQTQLFKTLSAAEYEQLEEAAVRYGRYLGKAVVFKV